jgi:hypothetical protein
MSRLFSEHSAPIGHFPLISMKKKKQNGILTTNFHEQPVRSGVRSERLSLIYLNIKMYMVLIIHPNQHSPLSIQHFPIEKSTADIAENQMFGAISSFPTHPHSDIA